MLRISSIQGPHHSRDVVSDVTDVLAHDLPLVRRLFAPIKLNCPPGTVVGLSPAGPTPRLISMVALNASMAASNA